MHTSVAVQSLAFSTSAGTLQVDLSAQTLSPHEEPTFCTDIPQPVVRGARAWGSSLKLADGWWACMVHPRLSGTLPETAPTSQSLPLYPSGLTGCCTSVATTELCGQTFFWEFFPMQSNREYVDESCAELNANGLFTTVMCCLECRFKFCLISC